MLLTALSPLLLAMLAHASPMVKRDEVVGMDVWGNEPVVKVHSVIDYGKCLAIPAVPPGDFAQVTLKDCNTDDGTVLWKIPREIMTSVLPAIERPPCLTEGDMVSVQACNADDPYMHARQMWFYTKDQRLSLSEQGKCLDLAGGRTEDSWLVTTECHDSTHEDVLNQVWVIEELQ